MAEDSVVENSKSEKESQANEVVSETKPLCKGDGAVNSAGSAGKWRNFGMLMQWVMTHVIV